MESSFTVQLFDILAYLIPGIITVCCIWRLSIESIPFQPSLGAKHMAFFLLLAFCIGVSWRVTTINGGQSQGIWGLPSVTRYVYDPGRVMNDPKDYMEDADMNRVRELVRRSFQVSGSTDYEIYKYAEAEVLERTNAQSASISKYIALSECCFNSMFPIGMLYLILLSETRSKRWFSRFAKRLRYFFFICLIILLGGVEWVLYDTSNIYYSTAVRNVLRAFLILHSKD